MLAGLGSRVVRIQIDTSIQLSADVTLSGNAEDQERLITWVRQALKLMDVR